MRIFNSKVDNFLASLFISICIPLFPLAVSYIFHKSQPVDWVLTAALYPASLFIQSKSRFLFTTGIAALTFFAISLSMRENLPLVLPYAQYAILGVSLIHVVERIQLHIIQGDPFFNFS
ncbi:hypothetical protein [Chitinophaga sp. CF418]|uniref:hypothetical protein n=1 Tax=Chitinophaga sp. CF418 TaxID=1855287 RepID=UPI00091F0713|nr:hypothetical protein [Chitinophaga sp. CF418]SHN36322.1 hypothetical protein SAMN05216311_11083 [Chitinophaga sp. CF418]